MHQVETTLADHIGRIGFANPARRHALGPALLADIAAAFDRLIGQGARVVVIHALQPGPVWSAGFDISALEGGAVDPLAPEGPLQALFARIQASTVPVMALLSGSAWGGAADLVLRCDIVLATADASLAFTPARLGLPYDLAGLHNVLQRGGLALALEMFATGQKLGAARALQAGLVNAILPDTVALAEAGATMAAQIAANAPLAVASARAQLRALAAAVKLDKATLQALAAQRETALASADYREGVAAFLARRQPRFHGD